MARSSQHQIIIAPRISEVNGAQHIGASVIPVWLEDAAVAYFQQAVGGVIPCAQLSPSMRKSEIDFLAEVFYPDLAEIVTTVEQIGNSSIVLAQQIIQRDALVCTARSVWVNVRGGSATAIAEDVAAQLEKPPA
jgi:acyl-CoA thioester hydrolase